ncbi:MAG: co-chaperone GroES, partial [Candidatus Aminicenantes bacterium]|nr:co-chaperone GroES [Candidatus Aminicenantes bacterium]
EAEEAVRGGRVIPDAPKEKPQEGESVADGDGEVVDNGQRQPMSVSVGDRVLFGKYAGTEVTLDDEEYLIMREDEVLGILED